jgi:hypothetical protein
MLVGRQARTGPITITYELLSHAIERSNNIVSLFKELENIRIDA